MLLQVAGLLESSMAVDTPVRTVCDNFIIAK